MLNILNEENNVDIKVKEIVFDFEKNEFRTKLDIDNKNVSIIYGTNDEGELELNDKQGMKLINAIEEVLNNYSIVDQTKIEAIQELVFNTNDAVRQQFDACVYASEVDIELLANKSLKKIAVNQYSYKQDVKIDAETFKLAFLIDCKYSEDAKYKQIDLNFSQDSKEINADFVEALKVKYEAGQYEAENASEFVEDVFVDLQRNYITNEFIDKLQSENAKKEKVKTLSLSM